MNKLQPTMLALLACLLLVLPSPSWAQPAQTTAAISGQAITPFGGPAASASVRICLITANGVPCSTTGVSLFSDYMLTQPVANPFNADQYGNYKVFLAAGLYSVQIFLPGGGQPSYTYYEAVSASASGGGGGGGNPAGVFSDVQLFQTSSSFGADSGFLQNNSTTHDLHQRQIDNIPYASQYCTFSLCQVTPNGITASSSTCGGCVTSVPVLSVGSYSGTPPTVTFSAPPSGVTATGTAVLNSGGTALAGITITNPGSGYQVPPTVTIGSGGATAEAFIGQAIFVDPVDNGDTATFAPLPANGDVVWSYRTNGYTGIFMTNPVTAGAVYSYDPNGYQNPGYVIALYDSIPTGAGFGSGTTPLLVTDFCIGVGRAVGNAARRDWQRMGRLRHRRPIQHV